jgi:hypothetical protein
MIIYVYIYHFNIYHYLLYISFVQYNAGDPSALNLSSFDTLTLTPLAFRQALSQTFALHLNGKELGALFTHFCSNPKDKVYMYIYICIYTYMYILV